MSLQVWLPLNGDLRNQGCSNVTVTNNGATVNASGKIGSCYYFNASSYLYENTYDWTDFNTSQFSLCCWYKQPSPVASGNSQIICIGTNSGWNNIRIGLLRRTSSGYPMFSVSNGSSAIQYNCTATTFSLDTWNHIVCTYDNGTIKIYLNGTLDKTYTTTIVPVLNSSQHLGVGAASNGAEKLTGYLNDVRIYDHCLSTAEVREIAQGLVLHYKLDQSNPNLISNDTFTNAPWATAIAAYEEYEGRLAYRLQCRTLYVNTSSGTVNIFPDITYQENMQYTLSITWRDDYRTDGKNSNLRITFNYTDGSATHRIQSPANTVSSWIHTKITSNAGKTLSKITASYGNSGYLYITDLKLEIGTLDTSMLYTDGNIEDSSGYQNNATLNGNLSIKNDSARYGRSAYFDTNNNPKATLDNISILSSLSNCTVSWWEYCTNSGNTLIFSGQNSYKFIAAGSTTTRLYDGDVGGNAILYKDGIQETNHNTSQQSAYLRNQHNGVFHTQNSWHHFTLVGADLSSWTTFKINGYDNSWPIRGNLSDVRVYCTALDADAIRQLYEVGAKVDNKQNLHAFELVENNSKIQITKQGQVKCNELEEDEQTKFYQTDQIIETNEIIEL